jgi:hypothetical protein
MSFTVVLAAVTEGVPRKVIYNCETKRQASDYESKLDALAVQMNSESAPNKKKYARCQKFMKEFGIENIPFHLRPVWVDIEGKSGKKRTDFNQGNDTSQILIVTALGGCTHSVTGMSDEDILKYEKVAMECFHFINCSEAEAEHGMKNQKAKYEEFWRQEKVKEMDVEMEIFLNVVRSMAVTFFLKQGILCTVETDESDKIAMMLVLILVFSEAYANLEFGMKFFDSFRRTETKEGSVRHVARGLECGCMDWMKKHEGSARLEEVECFHCLVKMKQRETKKCSRCKFAYYCSKECQKNNWKEHKLGCSELANHPKHYPR